MSDYRTARVEFPGGKQGSSLAARFFAIFILVFSIVGTAASQENRATITGIVTDAEGGAVVGAKVEAKNLGTQVPYDTVTTDAGLYTIPLVPAGNYSVTASRDGFRNSVSPNVEVRVSDRVQIDLTLQIGSVTQEVTVTAQAPLLETATASRFAVLDTQEVSDLPLEGRTTILLATLENGVQFPNNQPSQSARPFDNGLIENMTVNGGRVARNNFLLNGISNTAQESTTGNMNLVFSAPPDAVSEVKVQTSEVDAQYGHTAGGITDVNLKSGTNAIHGAAYWFVRNDALNANTAQNVRSGTPRQSFKWNEPGLEADGPVYIPHIYDGRDKTFWMFSWEHIKDAIPGTSLFTVPTALERQGDFSQDTSGGDPIIIYDPLTLCGTLGNPACALDSHGNPILARQPFPGNIIPANRINSVASQILSFWPDPTPGLGNIDHQNNFNAGTNPQTDAYDVFSYQVDQKVSTNNRVTMTYGYSDRHQRTNDNGIKEVASTGDYLARINHVAGVAWSSTLSPTTVLSLRYGFSRHELLVRAFGGELGATGMTNLGFPSGLVSQIPFPSFPNLTFTGGANSYLALGGAQGTFGGNQRNFSTNSAFSGAVTKVLNKHSLTIGGELNFVLNDRHNQVPISFVFSPIFTQQNPSGTTNSLSGDSFADFLLGYPGQPVGTPGATLSGSQPLNVSPAFENRYIATFVQDNWRVSSRLSLNLGLRWDIETPQTERHNQVNVGFNPTAPVSFHGIPNIMGGLLFASPNQRSPFAKDFGDWQPRLGMAFKLDSKTVLRAGYAKFYLPSYADQGFNQGFSTTNPYDASTSTSFVPINSLSNPYPGGLSLPTGSSLGTATALGTAINFSVNHRPLPYTKSFSVGIQRQFPKNFVFDLSYVGSRTRRLETNVNIDALSAANIAAFTPAQLNAQVPNQFAGLLPGTSLNGPTVSKAQTLLPFPQFTSVTQNNNPIGYSWYNSLQARLEHRFSSGLFFQASLTYSKNMEAISYLNPQDYTANPLNLLRVVAADDAPYRLRMSGGYQFHDFKSDNMLVRGVLNGWQLNAVVTLQSGIPVPAPLGTIPTGVNPALPNPTAARYFNNCFLTSTGVLSSQCTNSGLQPAWKQVPAFGLSAGSTRMSNVRLDEPANVDLSLFKSWPIRERLQMQFRAEAFNLTNTPYFNLGQGVNIYGQASTANTTLTNSQFGLESPNQGNDPRSFQLSLRLQF